MCASTRQERASQCKSLIAGHSGTQGKQDACFMSGPKVSALLIVTLAFGQPNKEIVALHSQLAMSIKNSCSGRLDGMVV